MSGSQTDLVTGLAQLLHDNGVGVYNPSGVYSTSTQWAITFGVVPSSPSTVICLSPRVIQSDPKLNDRVLAVQVRLRGTQDPRTVQDKSDEIFNLFEGLEAQDFGSMHLALLWQQTGQLDGQDDQLRWFTVESYYARCNVPTLYRSE